MYPGEHIGTELKLPVVRCRVAPEPMYPDGHVGTELKLRLSDEDPKGDMPIPLWVTLEVVVLRKRFLLLLMLPLQVFLKFYRACTLRNDTGPAFCSFFSVPLRFLSYIAFVSGATKLD